MKFILYYFVLLSGLVVTLFLPKYNQHVFVIRHLLIFVLAASIILMVVMKYYHRLLTKYEEVLVDRKLVFFKAFTLVTVIGLLSLVRFLQLDYIKLYETPPVLRCYYYDSYGNFIHGSRFNYVCPELEVLEQTDQGLSVQASYKYPGNRQDHLRGGSSHPNYYRGRDGYSIVNVDITYNDEGFIISYMNQMSTNYELLEFPNTDSIRNKELIKEAVVRKYYHSILLSQRMEYTESELRMVRKTQEIEQSDLHFEKVSDIKHYRFSNEDSSYSSTLSLRMKEKVEDHMDFDVFLSADHFEEERQTHRGSLERTGSSIQITYERDSNYGYPFITTIERSEKGLTRTFDGHTMSIETFRMLNNFPLMVKTKEYWKHKNYDQKPTIEEGKVYEFKNFSIVEGRPSTYKIVPTTYGYRVEEYRGDGFREEVPLTDDTQLVSSWGVDAGVFDPINPISIESNDYLPLLELNPLLKYLVEMDK